jgi:hypothetical protein
MLIIILLALTFKARVAMCVYANAATQQRFICCCIARYRSNIGA